MTATEGSPHSAFELPYVVSDNQLKTSALLNFVLGAVSLLIFISVRGGLRSVGGVYQRRRELQDLFLQPPQLLLGGLQQAWSWVTSVICMSDAEIARTAGFDALLLNRTILMGLQMFSVLTMLSLGILLPTYYSFDDVVTHRLHRGTNVAELSRTTISNLPPGHAILWLPTAAAFLVTAYCCWVLLVHCQSYAELRMAYMLCLDAAGRQPYQERRPRRTSRTAAVAGDGASGTWNTWRWGSRTAKDKDSTAHSLTTGTGGGATTAAATAAAPSWSAPGGCVLVANANPSLSAQGSAASLQKLLPAGPPSGTPRDGSLGGEAGLLQASFLPPLHPQPHAPPHPHPQSAQHAHLLLQLQQLVSRAHPHTRPHLPEGGVQPSASLTSLQDAPYAAAAAGIAVHHVPGLARMSYDPAAATTAPAITSVLSVSSLRPEPGKPLAPYASGAIPLRLRLRLVAPWLRHVVVTAAERAARHKAADNLLAWLDPLRMLAKDREDWARQQLAADDDPDPSLPPVPTGHPPPTTACHAGLLVASEDMLMALTGRADGLADPWVRAGGLGARIDWSENVAALAKSLGIWLRREGGQAVAAAGASGRGVGAGSKAKGEGCGWPEGIADGGGEVAGSGPKEDDGEKGDAGQVVRAAKGAAVSARGEGDDAGRGELGSAAAAVALTGLWSRPTLDDGVAGNSGSSGKAPTVYRYWAPEAEQRCFCRNLRRRQRRQAATAAAAVAEPGTPFGFESVLNPIFGLSAADLAAASAGGSTTGGGGGVAAATSFVCRGGAASAGLPPPDVAAAAGAADNVRRTVLHRLEGGCGVGGGGGSALSSSGGCGALGQSRAVCGGTPVGLPHDTAGGRSAGPSGGGGGGEAEGPGDGGGDSDEDDDASDVEGERPWTGWQQQPLVVGRCNARLRQLMKVRHGGRCHLVNTHHYAVLIRDVMLHSVERFNAIGLPVLRSSVEEGDPRGLGLGLGLGPGLGREPRDVEWGPGSSGGSGGGGAVASGKVAAAGMRSGSSGTARYGRRSGGGKDWDGGEASAAAGQRRCEGRSGWAGADGRQGGGSRSSSGTGEAGEGGTVGGDQGTDRDDENDEHDPLLSSEGTNGVDGDADADGGGGCGSIKTSRPDARRRRRRPRPLLQPASDLPLRDRAVLLVRELRQHRDGERRPAPGPAAALEAPALEAQGDRADADTGAGAGAGAGAAGCAKGAAGAADDDDDDEDPLMGPGGSLAGKAAAAQQQQQQPRLHAGAGLIGWSSGKASRAGSREHSACGTLPRPPPHAANGQPAQGWAGAASAANDSRGGKAGAAAWATNDGGSGGSATCLGPAPSPPPVMELPYDDSEEAAAVAAYYWQLFPDSFQRLVPVCNHRVVDELLFQWTAAMGQLAAALLAAHVAVRTASPPSPPATASGPAPGPSTSTSPRVSHSHVHAHTARRSLREASYSSQPASLVAAALGLGATSAEPTEPPPAAAGPAAAAASYGGQPLPAPPDLPPPGSSYSAAVRRAAAVVRRLQDRIAVERARALRYPTRRAYVALFSSQRDAAAAAQCSPLAPPSRAQPLHFRACAAPPPDSVYWPALWTLPTGRAARLLLSAPLLAVLVFPVGVLTGALANLPVAVCGGTPELNALYWPWFCSRQNSHSLSSRLAKSLLTGLLPSLISLGWNAWVLPMVLYLLAAIQSRCVSLPAMDRQMSRWFFWWSLLNMFVGAVVGGGIFQQLGAYLQDPGKLLLRIGTALPTTSNFFMHYTLTKGLYSNWLRVAWPHLGAMAGAILRSEGGAALPRSWQDVFLMHSPPGYRFSSFYNGVFQTLMVGLAYVVTAPLIAPIALLFFVTAYLTWRYAIVYVYERQYESGGQMFPLVFSHMTGYLLVAEMFTGAVLLTNGAWIQAALLWCSLTPLIVAFRRLCERRYLQPLEHPPMSLAMAAPPASVDASVYLPPALREGSVGWYPESGKVWEQYGIPKYVI